MFTDNNTRFFVSIVDDKLTEELLCKDDLDTNGKLFDAEDLQNMRKTVFDYPR